MTTEIFFVIVAPVDLRGVYMSWTACKAAVAGRHGVHIESARTAGEAKALLERSVESPEDESRLNGQPVAFTGSGGAS